MEIRKFLLLGNMTMVHMSNRFCKGAITTEASLVFPMMILCILPFLYLFRMLLCQMVFEKGLDECVKQMAVEMYVLERISILPEYNPEEEETKPDQTKAEQLKGLLDEYTGFFEEEGWKDKLQEWGYELAGELLLKQKLQKWLEAENLVLWGIERGWNGIDVTKSDFLYEEEGHHYLIKGVVTFQWETEFFFWKPKQVTMQRVYHCFVGEETEIVNKEDKEEENSEWIVYRIGKGSKYHSSGCYLLNKNVYTSTKSQAEMEGKQACTRCVPDHTITVYQTKGGEHYHTKSCSYLKPEVSSMKWEEAVRLGYTGCGLCQGENRYFS